MCGARAAPREEGERKGESHTCSAWAHEEMLVEGCGAVVPSAGASQAGARRTENMVCPGRIVGMRRVPCALCKACERLDDRQVFDRVPHHRTRPQTLPALMAGDPHNSCSAGGPSLAPLLLGAAHGAAGPTGLLLDGQTFRKLKDKRGTGPSGRRNEYLKAQGARGALRGAEGGRGHGPLQRLRQRLPQL